jgi:hypothetical protein
LEAFAGTNLTTISSSARDHSAMAGATLIDAKTPVIYAAAVTPLS